MTRTATEAQISKAIRDGYNPLSYQDGTPKFRINWDTGCWEWIGAMHMGGYGVACVHDRLVGAHRVAYLALKGDIPDGFQIDHLCRNRRCVNVMHLEAVSRRTNIRRGVRTKLTEEKVASIRTEWATGKKTQLQLGREYGVDGSIICEIVNGKRWLPA